MTDQTAITPLPIIAAASGLGAPDPRCGRGPLAVREALQSQPRHGMKWVETLMPEDGEPLAALARFNERVASAVTGILPSVPRLALVAGDHSCAIGTWRGVSRTIGPPGLIWIDAHMDAHTHATSPSGRWHGMPVAALLGEGEPLLLADHPELRPGNLSLIGVRSFEPAEAELLDRLGVRVYSMDDVRRLGLRRVMEAARQRAMDGTSGYGISVDLDGLDPLEVPGVGSPVVGGIKATEFLEELRRLSSDPLFRVFEVAEFNPVNDVAQRTLSLVLRMLTAVSGGSDESDH